MALNTTNLNQNTNELTRISEVLDEIVTNIDLINSVPMGILAPVIFVCIFVYTVMGIIKLRRVYRAEQISFNESNCRREELRLRHLNYTVNTRKYKLMLLVSIAEICCVLIPTGPFIITLLLNNGLSEYVERYGSDCGRDIVLKLVIQNFPTRVYIAFSKAFVLIFLSSLRLLVIYLVNAYRERLNYNNFDKHLVYLFIKVLFVIIFDNIVYTLLLNLFIYILLILIEYFLLWKSLKDLRWATKWKLLDLQRDNPNDFKTQKFRIGSKVYKICSHLLSISILSIVLSLLFLFNFNPIFDFATHINCYVHTIYSSPSNNTIIDVSIEPSVLSLISSILMLLENLLISLLTLTAIYPFSIFFIILVVSSIIHWIKNRNTGYPSRRPELVTSLLAWHRQRYMYKHNSIL